MEGALDPETMSEMAQLAAAMNRLYPPDDMANRYPFMGEDSLTYDEAMELMGQMQNMDELGAPDTGSGSSGKHPGLGP